MKGAVMGDSALFTGAGSRSGRASSRSLRLRRRTRTNVPGGYNILVKVVDIFGNDTTKLVEVRV